MPGITSGCSFGSTQRLQNNQDVWVWDYWSRPLWFQIGISLQLDDAHYVKQRKIKPQFFSSGQAKCKTMKISSSESTGEHPVLPLSEKMNYFYMLYWFITAGPQLHLPTLLCMGRMGEHQALTPGEQWPVTPEIHHRTADLKGFTRNQHLSALVQPWTSEIKKCPALSC